MLVQIQSYGFVLGEGEALFAQCGYSLSIHANFRRHTFISFFIQNANISFSICSQHALAHTVKDVADTAAATGGRRISVESVTDAKTL